MKKIIVVGGGISGLCSAYYLTKEGRYQVTVIDKNDITSGVSFINAGYVIPSHFISLAAPGMINKGLKWMFNSSSPFYIQPRFDMDFFKWALNFKKSATHEKVEKAVPVLKEINLKSRKLFEEIFNSLDFKFHYENKGLLMAFSTSHGEEEEVKLAERAINEGLDVKRLTKEELNKMEPGFSKKVIGAIHYQCDSHTTPTHFMDSLKSWLQKNGVNFILNQEIKSFTKFQNKIIAVKTGDRSYEADEFILTTGCWTSTLAKSLGLNIPIQGGKGYSMDVKRSTRIKLPAILVEAKVAVTPMDGYTRFAGTMEFSGNNAVIRKNRVETIANSVEKYYSNVEINKEEQDKAVSGLRPVSPDGLPYIGRSLFFNNLTIASGHAMMGWSLGPATGKLVSQIIGEKELMLKISPFSPERFH